MSKFFTKLIVLTFAFTFSSMTLFAEVTQDKLATAIQNMYNTLSSLQIQEVNPMPAPFKEQYGLFPSYVHIYLTGSSTKDTLRNDFKVFDNNFFVTAWVSELLISSQETHPCENISLQLNLALNALNTYHDKNKPNSSDIDFWPQQSNPNSNYWTSTPDNLVKIANTSQTLLNEITNFFNAVGLKNQFESFIAKYEINEILGATKSFVIPSDTDDSSINLSLGSMLFTYYKGKEESSLDSWLQMNSEISVNNFIKDSIKYAYEPFSNDTSNQTIDPRTYFFAHDFIENQANLKNTNLSLLTTWLMNQNENITEHNFVAMPFNVNNVDVSVCANFLNAITEYAIAYPNNFNDLIANNQNLSTLIDGTLSYVCWVLNNSNNSKVNNLENRNDIGTLYYPPKFNTYWFASRTVSALTNHLDAGKVSISGLSNESTSIINNIYYSIKNSLENDGTTYILSSAKIKSNHIFNPSTMSFETQEVTYWKDFIGVDDNSAQSDVLYTSAMAINTLINTWTYRVVNNSGEEYQYSLHWKDNVPSGVIKDVNEGVDGLLYFTNSSGFENAFFSGSVKGMSSLPYMYPMTSCVDFNGNPITSFSQFGNRTDIIGSVIGYMNETDFNNQAFIKGNQFNITAPTQKNISEGFPYWSSPAITYALMLDVYSKYYNLCYSNYTNTP